MDCLALERLEAFLKLSIKINFHVEPSLIGLIIFNEYLTDDLGIN